MTLFHSILDTMFEDYLYCIDDNLGIINFLEEFKEINKTASYASPKFAGFLEERSDVRQPGSLSQTAFTRRISKNNSSNIESYLSSLLIPPKEVTTNLSKNYMNWKQFYFNHPNKLKEFVYSFNFTYNIKILSKIMKKDTILQKDSELVNYLNYYFIRLLEENKVIGLNNNSYNLDSSIFNNQDNLYIIIFNTGLITSNNKYIYSINVNNQNNITNVTIPTLDSEEQNLKKWTCINFVDEDDLEIISALFRHPIHGDLTIGNHKEYNNIHIPEILEAKKHITIADFLFSSSIILNHSEIIFNPQTKIIDNPKSRKYIYDLWIKFKQYYLNNKQKNIPCNILKLDTNKLVDIIFNAIDTSIKKYSRNKHMIVHQYYFDSFISKGTIQLLIPICLDDSNNWTPHCVISLRYINDSYEIAKLLCLKFARLNARLVSEFDNGLWINYNQPYIKNIKSTHLISEEIINESNRDENSRIQQEYSDSSVSSNDNFEDISIINKLPFFNKFLRPCKHYFGLSGYKINSCKNGNKCHFSHDVNKVKVCKMWESSFCKNGDKCDFLHGSIKSLIKILPEEYSCRTTRDLPKENLSCATEISREISCRTISNSKIKHNN